MIVTQRNLIRNTSSTRVERLAMSNFHYPQPYSPPPPYRPIPPSYPEPTKPSKKRLSLIILFTSLTLIMITLCALLFAAGSTLFSVFTSLNNITSLPPTSTPVPPTLTPLKVYSVVGKPTINAQFINNVFEYYNSPAMGK